MKIGIITPVYNDRVGIEQAVNSVESQTYTNYIHYIYNDASTDDTNDYLKSLPITPNRIIVYANNNKKQSFARNCLIDTAIRDSCDLIAFLDSDDTWLPTHLSESLDNLTQQGADLVYHRPRLQFVDGSPAWPIGFSEPTIFIAKQLYVGNFIWISTVLVKSSAILDLRFDSSLDSIEDWDMWIQLAAIGTQFYKSQQQTASYLVKTNGQAQNGSSKRMLMQQKHTLLEKSVLMFNWRNEYDNRYICVKTGNNNNYDADFFPNSIAYLDGTIDQILSVDMPTIGADELISYLREWYRVLKPDGLLHLEFSKPEFTTNNLIKFEHVKQLIEKTGFETVSCSVSSDSCRIQGVKPNFLNLPKLDHSSLKYYDLNTYKEIYERNTYRCSANAVDNKIVLDVGANLGLFSILATALGAKKVVSVEAQATVFNLGLQPITTSYENITALHCAVDSVSGKQVYLENNHVCSQVSNNTGEPVTTISLGQLINDYCDNSSSIVLKIDVEGSEFPILLNTSPDIIRHFDTIFCELHSNFHEQEEWKNPETIRHYLNTCGFWQAHSQSEDFFGRTLYTEKWIRI